MIFHIIYTFILSVAILQSNFARADDDTARANMLYRQGMILYSEGGYKDAAKKMAQIQTDFPGYKNIKQTMINEAFFLFLDEAYPESAGILDAYLELYKNDDNLPYVYFLRATNLHHRKKSPTKEFYLIQQNIDAWNDVMAHDSGLYYNEAKFRIDELETMKCLHDLRVGDLYLERKDYFAAIRRFNNIMHCKTDRYYIETAKRLAISYRALKMFEQANKYEEIVESRPNHETPEELSFSSSVKNLLYDMVPDFGFLPRWLRKPS